MVGRAGAVGLIEIVESAYRIEADEPAWLRGVADAVRPFVDDGCGMAAFTYDLTDSSGFRMCSQEVRGTSPEWEEQVRRLHEGLDPAFAARLYGPGTTIGLVSERLDPVTHAREIEALGAGFQAFGYVDAVGVICYEPSGSGCCITAGQRKRQSPSRRTRALFGRVTTHVAAGLRLVRALTAEPEAILEPDGKVVHAEDAAKPAGAREVLRRAAKAIDRARGPLRRDDPAEALELWRGLVEGRWSLVDRFDSDGRRFLIARRNDPAVRDPRTLSLRERQVAGYVAMGQANKLVAYALGLSTSSVATHLASAMHKLGVRTRAELVTMLASLPADVP